MEKIVVVGASGHGRVVIDTLERESRYEIAGLLDRGREVGEQIFNYDVLGREEDLPRLIDERSVIGVVIAIGDNVVRSKVAEKLRGLCPAVRFVTVVHPTAVIGRDVRVGEGTVIMPGVVVNASSTVGRFCILNTNSSLDHDSAMDDFSSLAPRVATGGNCRIGQFSAINIGAVLSNGTCVGEHAVLGAGSTLLEDLASFKMAYGTPAKVVRDRQIGEPYM